MIRSLCAALTLALILPASAARAQFPANAEFADGADRWTLPAGARIAANEGTRGSLAIAGGWATSEPSAAPLSGWQRVELRIKGPGKTAQSRLLLALPPGDGEPAAQVALSAADTGSGWQTLSTEMLPPAGAPARVAIGAEGDGQWLIDSVSVAPVELARAEPPGDPGDPPLFPEPLPEGWQPEGLLDAISRPIAGMSQLLVQVGSFEVTLPSEVTSARGERGKLPLTVRNRATANKPLTVSVAAPPGFFIPDRTVTIRSGQPTAFGASVQGFALGTHHLRVTFRTEDAEASVPLKVTVTPSYPAPGVAFSGGTPPPEMLAQLAHLGISLVASAPGLDLPASLTRLWLLAQPWSEEALAASAADAAGCAEFAALYHARGAGPDADGAAATRALSDATRAGELPLLLLRPPADLLPGAPPSITEADLATASELGAAGAHAAASLRLPVLEGQPARAVTLDRSAIAGAQPAWTEFAASAEAGAVAAAIRQSARLPMFFSDLAARSTGSAETDAALLARTLVGCAYQGATGWTIAARPEDAPDGAGAWTLFDASGVPTGPVADAYRELSRELAGAVPGGMLLETPEIGSGPNAAIGFRPFIRGDEGILAIWNNTGAQADLVFEVRTPPTDVHTLSIGPRGVWRSYRGAFSFSPEARALNRPVVLLSLEPGEFRMLSMQLANPFVGWLSSVEFMPKIPRESGPRGFDGLRERFPDN